MPMINGRFYMNPGLGAALERARAQAGTGIAAPKEPNSDLNVNAAGGNAGTTASLPGAAPTAGADARQFTGVTHPVHRVEIEAANGKFLARLQRQKPGAAVGIPHTATDGDEFGADLGGSSPARTGGAALVTRQEGDATPHAELHVFTHHQDLLNFLKQELERHV